MNRFFGKSENIFEDYIIIDGSDVNHIKNVLRMKVGDRVTINGGNNIDYLCEIRRLQDDLVELGIISEVESDKELGAKIYLFQGLPKAEKMEMIIQKCVELGVHEIIPVSMKRCVVKLDDKKADSKVNRWQAICESAAKQSNRAIIPKVNKPMTFSQALDMAKSMDVIMFPYELASGMEATKEVLSKIQDGMSVAVFIGPEGGFDLTEVEKAKEAGAQVISLGKRILRTETAGLTVMAILMYHLETKGV